MTDSKLEDLERIKHRLDEAKTHQEKLVALGALTAYMDSRVAENEGLVRDLEPDELKKKQEEMKVRLDKWDIEAREILEREITDPEMLKAALDNFRYKEEVIKIAGTPFSQFGDDVESLPPRTAKQMSAELTEFRKRSETFDRNFLVFRVVLAVALLVVILWMSLDGG